MDAFWQLDWGRSIPSGAIECAPGIHRWPDQISVTLIETLKRLRA